MPRTVGPGDGVTYPVAMLSDRERRVLAQIEAHIRREEPTLAHFLTHASRPTPRRYRHPVTVCALMVTIMTVAVGAAVFIVGTASHLAPLVVTGLAVAMIGPLPVWLLTTSDRRPIRLRS
jgi:Flp pilus assembly protein TadB